MNETVFGGQEILGCVEDMNSEAFEEFNSIRVWVGDKEVSLNDLKIVVYNDADQNADEEE